MADLSTIYTLSTPGGNIVFNNGDLGTTTDLYWIQTLTGLDGAPIRAPMDNAPQVDGGLIHSFWQGPLHIAFEGVLIPQSVAWGSSGCPAVLNTLEINLKTALASILRADGTLSFTPAGGSAASITVRNEVPVEYQPTDNYYLRTFTFGLAAADPSF